MTHSFPTRRSSDLCFPASIAGAFRLNIGLRQTLFDKRFNKEPGAVVLRLFLRPNHLLQIDHPPEASNQRVSRKWIELFNTDDLRVLVARRVTRFDKVIGDLATAKHRSEEHTYELQS